MTVDERADGRLEVAEPAMEEVPDAIERDELRRRARFYHRLAPWFGAHFDVFCGRVPELGGVRARL